MTRGHTKGAQHDLVPDSLVLPAVELGRPVPGVIRRHLLAIARRFTEAATLPDDMAVSAHLATVEEPLRQVMQWTKRAGRPKKQETIGDQRSELRAQGHTLEQIAEMTGDVEIEAVLRSVRPSRTKKRRGQ